MFKAILIGLALFFSAFSLGNRVYFEKPIAQPSIVNTPTPRSSEAPTTTPTEKTYSTSTPAPTKSVKATALPTLFPTQIPQIKAQPKCFTPKIYPSNSGIVPFKAILQANAENASGYEWDPKGDGNWTPVSPNAVEFTYDKDGRYYVKMRAVSQDGQRSEICQTEVVVSPPISISVNGQAYRDKNCNDQKDSGEEGASGVGIDIVRVPGGSTVGSVTADGSGNYSFSANMSSPEETFDLQIIAKDSPGYRLHAHSLLTANLSLNNRSSTIDVPFVPEENVTLCKAN
jgi:hypothetical protein